MKTALVLIKRNIKMFFKDKGMFFTSLVTPAILLILYATFLSGIYRSSFTSSLPDTATVADDIIDALVGGQLMSSILAVSCVTVAFCSNFLMVQDKATGTIKDLMMSPVKSGTLSISYYIASLASTLLICIIATGICLIYMAFVGWFFALTDILLLLADIFLLTMFGTAMSSIVNIFLSTQGQMTAVGTIVSAGYGFICGAYMPIYSFSSWLQKAVMFLPGTYGTSLIRNHTMQGTFTEMANRGIPTEVIEIIKDSIDCNLYFFEREVDMAVMYAVLGVSVAVLVGIYVLVNFLKSNKK